MSPKYANIFDCSFNLSIYAIYGPISLWFEYDAPLCLCYHRMSLERTSFEITSLEWTSLERTSVKTMSVKTQKDVISNVKNNVSGSWAPCSGALVSYLSFLIPFRPTNQIYTGFYTVLQKKMNDDTDSSLIYINDVQNWILIKGMLKVTCRVTWESNINICGTLDQPKKIFS